MEKSKYLLFGQLKDSEEYYIINPLTKQADIMEAAHAEAFKRGEYLNEEELIEKGYLVDPLEEQRLYRSEYLDFIDNRDTDEVQIFYVPTYACNFACSYCYQAEYTHQDLNYQPEVIDAFFDYIDREFAGRDKYITIFGGEPLLPNDATKKNIAYLLEKATERKLGIAIVTNGYTLTSYVPLLKTAIIKELQVTLDGPEAAHDKRRMLRGGSGTFAEIVEGIDAALAAGLPVNLRAVVDRENFPHLIELAHLAIDKGWAASPLFKTQLGRNYELHSCQSDQSKLYDRVSLYEDLYAMIRENPEFLEFHTPAYSISKFLFEHGEMPDPLFDSCPACKTEWAFDYSGRIYSCTATVGKDDEVLGTFYPTVTRKDEIIEQWEERDVTTIPECKDCSMQLACGGGCGSVAKNSTGRIQSADCRPVNQLIGMGLSLYFQQLGQE